MARKQQALTVVMALIAGLVGGVVSSHFLGNAFAEKKAEVQEVLKAEGFSLVDKAGKTRASLALHEGNPMLLLFNRNEKSQMFIRAEPDATTLMLYGNEDSRAWMTAQSGQISVGGISDKGHVVNMVANPDGVSLKLYDKAAQIRAVLGTNEVKHENTGSTETRAPSSLVLFDEDGKGLFSAP